MPRKYLVPVLLALFILFFTVFGDNGLLNLLALQRSKQDVQERIKKLTQENAALKLKIEALKNDRRYLEGLARTNFGLVKANEVVFRFDSSARTRPPVAYPAAVRASKPATAATVAVKPKGVAQ